MEPINYGNTGLSQSNKCLKLRALAWFVIIMLGGITITGRMI